MEIKFCQAFDVPHSPQCLVTKPALTPFNPLKFFRKQPIAVMSLSELDEYLSGPNRFDKIGPILHLNQNCLHGKSPKNRMCAEKVGVNNYEQSTAG